MNRIKTNKVYRRIVEWTNAHFPVTLAKLRYRMLFGKPLHLNPPETLNEKILWLSLFSNTTEWSRLADKFAVRDYIKEKGYESLLVKLYGKWDKAEQIDWNSLPNSFVLKTNHGCGAVWIVEDKNQIDKSKICEALNTSVSATYGLSTTEKHYSRIPPCIIAEELLTPSEEDLMTSSSIVDYKFWCLNGKVVSIWVVSNRHPDYFDGTMFDRNWNVINNVVKSDITHVRTPEKLIKRPELLDEMIKVSEKLSSPFPEVRVDLYYVNKKIYFGEMTFTTHGGTIDYMTESYLMEMGRKLDISKEISQKKK